MKDYIIVMAVGADALEERVRALISEGYQPLGGIAVTTTSGIVQGAIVVTFYQAMAR